MKNKYLINGGVLAGLMLIMLISVQFQRSVEASPAIAAVPVTPNPAQSAAKTATIHLDNGINNDSLHSVAVTETEKTTKKRAPRAKRFKATAYCLRGRTASGRMVRRGIVAADPRVLPLGSRIKLTAGRYSGTYLVADTGGKIKGNILDIWVPSCREARRWGRRSVKVTVLKRAKPRKKSRRRARRN